MRNAWAALNAENPQRQALEGGTIGQRPFTGLLKEEHDLNTVISGWTGEGAEEEQLVAENKVAEYQDRWRWKEDFPGVQ